MKFKNLTKKRFVLFLPIIVIIIGLLSAIYFIDLSKFNKNHKDYNETYMIKMMYLVADKNIASEDATIDFVSNDADSLLFSMNEVIPLEKKGDYLYGYLDNFTNDKLLEKTTDVIFANNNDFGEVIDGCEYDSKTKTIKIPFSYYENIGEYEVPLESQILSLMSIEDLMSMDVDVSSKKLVTTTKKVGANNLSMETNIPLYNTNIKTKNLEVYVNNTKTPVDKDYLTYDEKNSILTLYMPAILIDKVDIKVTGLVLPSVSALTPTPIDSMHAIEVTKKPSLPSVSSGKSRIVQAVFYEPGGTASHNNNSNAVTCHDGRNTTSNMGAICLGGSTSEHPGMNIDRVSSSTNNPFSLDKYTMYYSYIPKDFSGSGDSMSNQKIDEAPKNNDGTYKDFYKINYSVSNTYAARLSIFDSEPAYERYYDFTHRNDNPKPSDYRTPSTLLEFEDNKFYTIKYTIEDNEQRAVHGTVNADTKITVSADDMKDYWFSLHCVRGNASVGQDPNLYFNIKNVYEDDNSMIVRVLLQYNEQDAYLANQGVNSTQGAVGYIKFHWVNKCRVKPTKIISTTNQIPTGAKATFKLYEGGATPDGTNCSAAANNINPLDTKTVTITDDRTTTGAAFDANLNVGSIYCMKETAFKDENGNNLFDHGYSIKKEAGKTVMVFTAVDEHGDNECDNKPSITNKQKLGCYRIRKVDKESGEDVTGTTWVLHGKTDNQDYYGEVSEVNGAEVLWDDLPFGQEYTLKEITEPNPADLDGNGSLDYWNDNSEGETITPGTDCPNAATKTDTKVYYCLKVKKEDIDSHEALDGAEFTASKTINNTTVTIDKDSKKVFDGQEYPLYDSTGGITSFFLGDSSGAGEWTVTETKAPDGYNIDVPSKTLTAIPLEEYENTSSHSASWFAREACLNSSDNGGNKAKTIDGRPVADLTYNFNSGNNDYVFLEKKKKYVLNWFKTTEDEGEIVGTKVDGTEFVVKSTDNEGLVKFLTVSEPVSIKDSNNVEKACYAYTGVTLNRNNASTLVSGENGSTDISMTGEVCIAGLPEGDYTIEEINPPEYHTFNGSSTITLGTSDKFTAMNETNKIVNYATEFKFKKKVSNTDGSQEDNTKYTVTINGVTKTVSLSEMTTEELKKIGFTIYDSDGHEVPVKYISPGNYEYGANTVDQKGTGNNTTVLHLDDNREIYVKHLPKGNYTIKEVDTSNCQLSNGGYGTSTNPSTRPSSAPSCVNGATPGSGECIGYYSPDYSSNTYSFTINECSSTKASTNTKCSSSNSGTVTKELENIPTSITLTKKDFYSQQDSADVVDKNREKDSKETVAEFENDKERSDFDRIDFKVKDSRGNYLNFIFVDNSSTTCSSDSDYSIYRYIPGLALPSGVDPNVFNYHAYGGGFTITQTLHACGGHIKLIGLCRGETYTFEEVKVPDDSVYVLQVQGNKNPEACFEIPCTTDEPVQRTSKTVIDDKPTRVTFEKKDAKYNYLIPDEKTTFEVYRCPKVNGSNTLCNPSNYSTVAEREAAGMKLVKFEPRGVITGDEEDPGLEVYRMMSDSDSKNKSLCANNQSSNCYVTSLHPKAGRLVLRYLQSGYNYVLLETVAPEGYLLPTGKAAETSFTVSNRTVEVEQVSVPNKPVGLIIRKYADKDGDGKADDGKLLGGAKFNIYKVTNYNANKKPADQEKELIQLKTIKDGIYENRPTLDTYEVVTCTGENCSYSKESLGYNNEDWENFEDMIKRAGNEITTVLKEGTAFIQYLDYDTYYLIEEVEAPKGYSLPEKDDNRFTLVHITRNETEIIDTKDALVNKPTSFTFYKFDEYNTPLDGATFYLQKLDKDKKYNTLTVTKETLENGNVIYKADPKSDLKEITTQSGKATVYYLEPGQYRILEVKAAEGYELPKKTINVATFFVDSDGTVYGNNIITNKKPSETIEYLANSKAELVINIQTGKVVIKYGLIITLLIGSIVGLIIFLRKRK